MASNRARALRGNNPLSRKTCYQGKIDKKQKPVREKNSSLCEGQDGRARGIYAIKNTITGKFYVGSAIKIKNRWAAHLCELRRNKHHSEKLQRSWNKHGEASFEFVVLEFVDASSDLVPAEQCWIDQLNSVANGYNVNPTAASSLGVKRRPETVAKVKAFHQIYQNLPDIIVHKSQRMKDAWSVPSNRERMIAALKLGWASQTSEQREELCRQRKIIMGAPIVRAKVSASRIGMYPSAEARIKMSAARVGQVQSEKTREKRILTLTGHSVSEETREKIRAANKGRKHPPHELEKMRIAATGRIQSKATIAKRLATWARLKAEKTGAANA